MLESLVERVPGSVRREAREVYERCRFGELTDSHGMPMDFEGYLRLGKELKKDGCRFVYMRDFNGSYIPLSVCDNGILRPQR